jgi:predicted nucleic acid-binding protein
VILVDSSVWIDCLRGTPTPQADKLDTLPGNVLLAVGDLILTVVPLGAQDVAIEAARNGGRLRALGVTVRKTIDTVIATCCIVDKLELLHSDQDFDPFERHLGPRCVPCEA